MTSVNEYFSRLDNMSREETESHLRSDYREQGQEWPDYLDYIDEWEASYEHTLTQTRKDFIYSALAKRHQKIICGDHHHVFSIYDGPNIVFVPNPDFYVDYQSCWYQTIVKSDTILRCSDTSIEAPRLSLPESSIIKNLTKMRLMLSDSTTFDKLSFSDFKEKWWSKESRDQARRIFLESRTPTIKTPDEVIQQAIHELPPPPPLWLCTDNQVNTILTNSVAIQQHGFHALLRTREDRHPIIDMINKIRSLATNYEGPISRSDLATAIQHCPQCSTRSDIPSGPSYPGVYYAPPGNGKSKSQDDETFIGIDTDLLISMSDFKTIIDPFLRIGIPVITNQYHLAQHSGERFFGIFNKHHLRQDPRGIRYTTIREIISARETISDDLFIRFVDNYFSDNLT